MIDRLCWPWRCSWSGIIGRVFLTALCGQCFPQRGILCRFTCIVGARRCIFGRQHIPASNRIRLDVRTGLKSIRPLPQQSPSQAVGRQVLTSCESRNCARPGTSSTRFLALPSKANSRCRSSVKRSACSSRSTANLDSSTLIASCSIFQAA
jgi:hypothetical protein